MSKHRLSLFSDLQANNLLTYLLLTIRRGKHPIYEQDKSWKGKLGGLNFETRKYSEQGYLRKQDAVLNSTLLRTTVAQFSDSQGNLLVIIAGRKEMPLSSSE